MLKIGDKVNIFGFDKIFEIINIRPTMYHDLNLYQINDTIGSFHYKHNLRLVQDFAIGEKVGKVGMNRTFVIRNKIYETEGSNKGLWYELTNGDLCKQHILVKLEKQKIKINLNLLEKE